MGEQVALLDFRVFKGPRFRQHGLFDLVPVTKNKGPTLSATSSHPMRTHTSWPLSHIRNLWMRSTALADFYTARAQFVERLFTNTVDSKFVQFLIKKTHFIDSFAQLRDNQQSHESGAPATNLRFPLDFHPLLESRGVVSKALSNINGTVLASYVARLLGVDGTVVVRTSWKLRGRPSGNQFQII